ncbi:MAG: hypothetical protein LBI41_01165 [Lactobacillales bacterium]|jgi:hypothetical protein|nr:hypothetical protein [Lactobacillales bacterium]
MKKKFKKIVLAVTVILGITATVIESSTVYADWQTKRVMPITNGSFTLNDDDAEENAIASTHHNFLGTFPNVVFANTYNGIYDPVYRAFYMKIPLNDAMRDNASSYLGVDRAELESQEKLVVVIQSNSGIYDDNDDNNNNNVELRPQWVFANYVPEIGTPPGTIQDEHTPHTQFNLFANVNMDARVFGPNNGVVSNPIRYDQATVSFHDQIVPRRDAHGNICRDMHGNIIYDSDWYQALSPDNLHLGFKNDGQCRAVLSYVDFNAGLLGEINHVSVGAQAIPKQLTLNILIPNVALHSGWDEFVDGATNGYSAGHPAPAAIGDILLRMYGQHYISREVMYYLLGFEDVDMLDLFLAIPTAPIISAPLRGAGGGGHTSPPPHTDSDPIPVVTTTSPVNVSTSATPSFRTLSKTWPRPLPAVTPQFEMSSGIPDDEELLTVYRVYNPNDGFHHYTMNRDEVDHLVSIGWRDEGEAFKCNKQGVPVYRVYNRAKGIHHFTTNSNERDDLVNNHGWEDEGIAWYALMQGEVPVYRIYNPGNGEHVWTTSHAEVENAVAHGWNDEGIAWYMQ